MPFSFLSLCCSAFARKKAFDEVRGQANRQKGEKNPIETFYRAPFNTREPLASNRSDIDNWDFGVHRKVLVLWSENEEDQTVISREKEE